MNNSMSSFEDRIENNIDSTAENSIKSKCMRGVIRTCTLPLDKIRIAERIRTDNGDISELAASIEERGLLNPISVMEEGEGGYMLIAGLRRLAAVRMLGEEEIRATVFSPMDADEALMAEYAENENRLQFSVSEKLVFKSRFEAIEREKGKVRQHMTLKQGNKSPVVGDRPPRGNEKKGKVRDLLAKASGFSSEKQMRRATEIAEKRPDLLKKVDAGELTITGAERVMREEEAVMKSEQNKEAAVVETKPVKTQKPEKPAAKHTASTASLISEKEIEVEFYEAFKPFMLPAPGDVHTISGADHDALMENPIYKQLFEAYNDAVNQVNSARGDLRMRCQGYEREIRGYRENIETMRVELERLREAAHAGT